MGLQVRLTLPQCKYMKSIGLDRFYYYYNCFIFYYKMLFIYCIQHQNDQCLINNEINYGIFVVFLIDNNVLK